MKKLIEESEEGRGNKNSIKIVDKIDKRVLEWLRQAVKEQKKYGYRYRIGTDIL